MRIAKRRSSRELLFREQARELDQRERIACTGLEDTVSQFLREPRGVLAVRGVFGFARFLLGEFEVVRGAVLHLLIARRVVELLLS